ncbi:MAG: glutamine-hydrolyzing GMP synthase [Candidatus Micrarchaeota archaeon]|nr:glutamine-hydrolyzing GMP synthase [Candidatus Micrarchaeota archaeon]
MGATRALKANSGTNRSDAILILNFGGQYTHLIGRNVRENSVYSEIVPNDTSARRIKRIVSKTNVKGIILSGGPDSVYQKGAPGLDQKVLDLGIPVLGLCYGHQLIAKMANGVVKPAEKKEFGGTKATIDRGVAVLKGLEPRQDVWMSHGDTVYSMPPEYEVLAHTDNTPVAAFRHKDRPIYGLQWHPEVMHTKNGVQMLRNFLFDQCGCKPDWKMEDFAPRALEAIKHRIRGGSAVVALSGGVDSSVATALVAKAIGGEKMAVVYVDTGLMRKGETEQVRETFSALGTDLRIIDAEERFVKALKGVVNPEKKRKIIGRLFIRIFEEQAALIKADYLVQGTIYPDTIESKGGIKTHHNIALPRKLKFRGIVEPLKDLYKDEVRIVGRSLGLPDSIVDRQPFPGPGLAVRIKGEVTKRKLEMVREADWIVTSEIEKAGLAKGLWQYFATLTDTRSVGVRGDSRSYKRIAGVNAYVSRDAMTAEFAELPWDVLRAISTRITNEVPGIGRPLYNITDKPPGTIEWE